MPVEGSLEVVPLFGGLGVHLRLENTEPQHCRVYPDSVCLGQCDDGLAQPRFSVSKMSQGGNHPESASQVTCGLPNRAWACPFTVPEQRGDGQAFLSQSDSSC